MCRRRLTRSPDMKPFVAIVSLVCVFWTSAATAAPQAPDPAASQPTASKQTPATVSAPTLIRLDGQVTVAKDQPRREQVLMVVSLYAEKDDTTPLWTEQQLTALDA